MISLGTASNFYTSTYSVSPGSWARGSIVSGEIREVLVLLSPQGDFLQGIIETTSINSLSFIFTIPVHFIYSTIKASKYYSVVVSLVLFLLLPLAICFLVLCLKGAKTQRTLLLASTSVTPSRPRWSRINNPVRKKWEKGGTQPIVSYMVYLIMVDTTFS